jgi:hypothetical protein
MKQNIYMHNKAIRERWKASVVNKGIKDLNNHIVVETLKICKLSHRVTKYYPIIRQLSRLYHVKVLRNPHNTNIGIFIVGRGMLVFEFKMHLTNIMQKVETYTSRVKKNRNNRKYRLAKSRKIFRLECINLYMATLSGLKRPKENMDHLEAINELIQQSNLKTFKAFKW